MERDINKINDLLFELPAAVNGFKGLEDFYEMIRDALNEILDADHFHVVFDDPVFNRFSYPPSADQAESLPSKVPNFELKAFNPLIHRVMNQKKPILFHKEDISFFTGIQADIPPEHLPELWMAAPIVINQECKGVAVVWNNTSATALAHQDLPILHTISHHIALAVERKIAQEKLSEQGNVLKKIMEFSPVGICIIENSYFKWVNNEMVKIFGYDAKSDFQHRRMRMIYKSETDYENAGKIILHDLREKGKAGFDFELIKKDNTTFNAHVIITGSSSDNSMASSIAIITDNSQHELIQQERYEMERLQGVFELAGAVCHEINQPLQAILGYSELLILSGKMDDLQDNKLRSIKNQAARLGEITKKLSSITHYRTVDYPGNLKIVDIWGASSE